MIESCYALFHRLTPTFHSSNISSETIIKIRFALFADDERVSQSIRYTRRQQQGQCRHRNINSFKKHKQKSHNWFFHIFDELLFHWWLLNILWRCLWNFLHDYDMTSRNKTSRCFIFMFKSIKLCFDNGFWSITVRNLSSDG